MNGIFDLSDVAEYLRVSIVTVRRLIKKGLLPHRRVGRRIIMLQEDINILLSNSLIPKKEDTDGNS